MNKHDDGGPAFPTASSDMDLIYGMTLRQWYAGQALKMFTAKTRGGYSQGDIERCQHIQDAEWIAQQAFTIADVMLMEGRKGRKP